MSNVQPPYGKKVQRSNLILKINVIFQKINTELLAILHHTFFILSPLLRIIKSLSISPMSVHRQPKSVLNR